MRTGCTNPALNGPETDTANYTLTVTNDTIAIREVNGPTAICNWNGSYSQAGRLGAATGTTICEDNIPATFTFTDLQISAQSFGAKFVAVEQAGNRCTATGYIGGPRK